MKKKIQPLGDRIVVDRKEAQTKKGGILLPESAREKQTRGKVVAVGPGKVNSKGKLEALEVKIGDEVLFSSYSGAEYKQEGLTYVIVSIDDVLAIDGGAHG